MTGRWLHSILRVAGDWAQEEVVRIGVTLGIFSTLVGALVIAASFATAALTIGLASAVGPIGATLIMAAAFLGVALVLGFILIRRMRGHEAGAGGSLDPETRREEIISAVVGALALGLGKGLSRHD
jgi:hypothetical protein